ncbi:Far upstream element-binding protein 3 [Nowakowskiella sp. JEL0407]|nr:Far upstream element-binding protein 3 [Nowakowskiella sp. JEL0407]
MASALERALAIAKKLSVAKPTDAPERKRNWDDGDSADGEYYNDRNSKRTLNDRDWDSREKENGSSRTRHGLGSSESSSSHYGPGGIDNRSGSKQVEEKYPANMVGLIIGKGGETLKMIERQCGVKLQFNNQEDSSSEYKVATLIGTSDDIEKAKQMISEIVDRSKSGKRNLMNTDPSKATVYIEVPATKVGLVIGKGGETIRTLELQSGAKMAVATEPPPNVVPPPNIKYVTVCGDDIAIATARRLIDDIIFQPKLPPGIIMEIVLVPSDKIGGETIKQIQQTAQIKMFVEPSNEPQRTVTLTGPPERVEHAKSLIDEKVNRRPQQDPYAGYHDPYSQGYGGYDQSAGGGGDYQAQWEEYYKQQALWNQYYASAPSTDGSTSDVPPGATTGTTAPASSETQGSEAADYTEQWKEYYKQMGYNFDGTPQ